MVRRGRHKNSQSLILIVLSVVLSASCRPEPPILPASVDTAAMARPDPLLERAAALVAQMDDRALAGQVVMMGVDGLDEPSAASVEALGLIKPGAVVLFGFNISLDPRAVASLTRGIRSAVGDTGLPPFVAIDHEGGSVYRFKGGLTRLPSARAMGAASSGGATAVAVAAGAAAGSELFALGITMNLAPVVEAAGNGSGSFMGDRVWSDSPYLAGLLSGAFIEACQREGVAAVAKHFPGNAAVDPHRGLPVIAAPRVVIEGAYYAPFRAAIGAGASAVMLSHALVPALDPDAPASLSSRVIASLKGELGFDGIVMTDDLVMAALDGYGDLGEVAIAALRAGVDMLMLSGGRPAAQAWSAIVTALQEGTLPRSRLQDAAIRIVRQKLALSMDAEGDDGWDARLDAFESTVEGNRAALAAALSGGAP
ncbi:MAG: hypothetical protein JXM71_00775 [Spirochaetales bacterium]|nr:hypothetical protein [Spirochaetales bacterium]